MKRYDRPRLCQAASRRTAGARLKVFACRNIALMSLRIPPLLPQAKDYGSGRRGYFRVEPLIATGTCPWPYDNCSRNRDAAQTVHRPRTSARGPRENATRWAAWQEGGTAAAASIRRTGIWRTCLCSPQQERIAIRRLPAQVLLHPRERDCGTMRARPSSIDCNSIRIADPDSSGRPCIAIGAEPCCASGEGPGDGVLAGGDPQSVAGLNPPGRCADSP